nr:hypothetical protein C5F59_25495 [Streptomyces sp. QL37]
MHHVGVTTFRRVPYETDLRSPRTGERIEVTGALCPDCAGASSGRRHRTPPARQGLPFGTGRIGERIRCVQLQGGGGSRRGASATDDTATDVRAGAREPGPFRKAGPRSGLRCRTG